MFLGSFMISKEMYNCLVICMNAFLSVSLEGSSRIGGCSRLLAVNRGYSRFCNHRVRKITPAGMVSTIAGDGTAGFADGSSATAKFDRPRGMCADTAGNLYVTGYGNHRVRKITPAGMVITIAGDGTAGFADGLSATAKFQDGPQGMAADAAGNVFVADSGNNRVRMITPFNISIYKKVEVWREK